MDNNVELHLLSDIILSTQRSIPRLYRKEFYKLLIDHFDYYQCNNIEECLGIDTEFDQAFYELYPNNDTPFPEWRE